MGLTAANYREQLLALLPPSSSLDVNEGSNLWLLLDALAEEMARCGGSALNLLKEVDPRTLYDLLNEYELMMGLPAACAPEAQTLAERRSAVFTKLTERGGQSIAYFEGLAAKLGFNISIQEFDVHHVGVGVNAPLNGVEWRFAFQVNTSADAVHTNDVVSGVNEPLRTWGYALFECAINEDKPAHTHAIFAYI